MISSLELKLLVSSMIMQEMRNVSTYSTKNLEAPWDHGSVLFSQEALRLFIVADQLSNWSILIKHLFLLYNQIENLFRNWHCLVQLFAAKQHLDNFVHRHGGTWHRCQIGGSKRLALSLKVPVMGTLLEVYLALKHILWNQLNRQSWFMIYMDKSFSSWICLLFVLILL